MRKHFRIVTWGFLLLILIFAGACSPAAGPDPGEVATDAGQGEVTQEVGNPQPEGNQEGNNPDSPAGPPGVPEDIPIAEGAYKLQVARNGANVNYQVDGVIDDVVAFYQQMLPELGWTEVTNPDTVGSIAILLRENEAGDRVSINMQKNEVGGFVVVSISVTRKQ
jgi:hypothetical protein